MAAGAVAVGVTLLIERLGGMLGGLLGTLPSTIVLAALGIYASSPATSDFRDAMGAVPVGMAVNGLFLMCWRWLPPLLPEGRGPRVVGTASLALAVWAGAALVGTLGIELLQESEVPPLLVGATAFAALELGGWWACRVAVPSPSGTRTVGTGMLVARGALAGSVVGLAGYLAAIGSPLLAGMASVFPAIFLTTMISLWWSQASAVPFGAIGPMILGSGAVSAYALVAAISLPAFGPLLGSVVAWGIAAGLVTLPAWFWLRSRRVPES